MTGDGASDAIPLAEEDFFCAACGQRFKPKGGESTCPACLHVAPQRSTRVAARPTSCSRCGYDLRGGGGLRCPECGATFGDPRRVPDASSAPADARAQAPERSGRRVRGTLVPALIDRSRLRVGEVFTVSLVVVACAVAAFVAAFAHWLTLVGGDWMIAVAWAFFALAALVTFLCTAAPPDLTTWERRCGLVGLVAAIATMLLLAAYPLRAKFGGIPLAALHDFLTVVAGVLFIVGTGRRLRLVAAWTGFDPHEEGFLVQSGPMLLSIFIVSSAYLLTHFFRRGLDAADAYALAIATWLVWRAGAIAWHTLEVVSSRAATESRSRRLEAERPPAAVRARPESRR